MEGRFSITVPRIFVLHCSYSLKTDGKFRANSSGEGKGPVLSVVGKFTATLTQGEKEIAEPVYVVKGQGDTALLSSGTTERMGLVEYQLDLTTSIPLPFMLETQ